MDGSGSISTPPPDEWRLAHQRLFPQWQSLALSHQAQLPIAISRVNQFDAGRLDVEMAAMLKEQLVKVFSLMKPGMLFQYEPELDAFLEFLIWRFSIWVDKPTPGNALMNLRYRDERASELRGKVRTGLEGPGLTVGQKMWYCIATVGGQYFWARLQSFSAFRRWGDSEQRPLARRAWVLIQHIEGLHKAASFANLLLFLYTGRFRLRPNNPAESEPFVCVTASDGITISVFSNVGLGLLGQVKIVCAKIRTYMVPNRFRNLVERALRARLVYGNPNMNRAVSFEYMNRQLVWNEFSEMLLLLLPLLNSSSFKSLFSPFSKNKSSSSKSDDGSCPICQATPTIPFLAHPCQHRYCYYCLRTRCSAAPSFRCPKCNEPVVAMQRDGGSTTNQTNPQSIDH